MQKAAKNLERLFFAFLFINPVLDVLSGAFIMVMEALSGQSVNQFDMPVTPSLVVRMFFLLLFALYALIIADKTDVRRSRVRNTDFMTFDIHDRVNYAVEYSNLHFSDDKKALVLDLKIDTEISSVLEYFEIFMERMLLSKRAALFFDKKFKMYINGSNIL